LRLPKNQEIKRFFHTSLGAKRSPKITARSEVIDGFFFGFIHPVHAAFILRNTSKEYIFLNPNLSLAVVKQKNRVLCKITLPVWDNDARPSPEALHP